MLGKPADAKSVLLEPNGEKKLSNFFKFLLLAGFLRSADKKEAMSSCDTFCKSPSAQTVNTRSLVSVRS